MTKRGQTGKKSGKEPAKTLVKTGLYLALKTSGEFLKRNRVEVRGALVIGVLLLGVVVGYEWVLRAVGKTEEVGVDKGQAERAVIKVADYPVKVGREEVPFLTAQSVSVVDWDSGVTLYEKNSEMRLLPASTTKIMTALVVLENYDLGEVLEARGGSTIEGAKMGLREGEKITVYNLIFGLLLASGNDAAFVLASNFSGGVEQFINSMNRKAKELGMKDTHFSNVDGFGSLNHYTTSKDLALLTNEALKNKTFAKIVATPRAVVPNSDYTYWYPLVNINELIGDEGGVLGVKTGFTEKAGQNLVVYVNRDRRRVVMVVLNSADRFGEMKRLIEWVYRNYEWRAL